MDESESRRERLKAMRAVAEEAEASGNPGPTGSLANPLLETPAPNSEVQFGTQRFDFYTDPMAAFSANKRHIQGPRNPSMSSGPPIPMSEVAQPEVWRGRPPYRAMNPPYPVNRGFGRNSNYGGGRGDWHAGGNVGLNPPYPMNQGFGGNPNYRGGRGDWHAGGNIGLNPPYPKNQGFGGNSNYRGGRGDWRGGGRGSAGAHQNFSQGRGQWRGMSPRQGVPQGGGRGRGFPFNVSVEDETIELYRYYDKSMFEDPWQNLQPVVWKEVSHASNSLVSKYISMKKPRLSEPSRGQGSGTQQQSLAAYLATSFNEAANDASSA